MRSAGELCRSGFAIFTYVATRRYVTLAVRDGNIVTGKYDADTRTVKPAVDKGFRKGGVA